MFSTARKTAAGVAGLAALALGGSAIADAASTTTTQSNSSSQTTAAQSAPQGRPPAGAPGGAQGGHTANGKTETLLTGDTAAKVKAAALDKIPGGTIERVETDADFGSPYEAHVRKADGTSVQVLVDDSFQVTAVKSMP
ncbi:MAG: PepSY domain-containing protein [Thermoleophilaceae bacterium]|jgi:hypothetical protein